MRRLLKLVDQFCKPAAGFSSSSSCRCLLVNMPMLTKSSFSKLHGISSLPNISTADVDDRELKTRSPLSGQPSQFFVDYHIYKGKGALCMEPIAPVFNLMDSGSIKISKVGAVHLQFAHSVGERQYDWKKRQIFSLSVTELGNLLSLSPDESCEFFHDPFMGKSDEGKVRKVLQVTPLPSGPGYFFTLKVSNAIEKIEERFNVPITKAEFTVMRTTFNFILPYIMGWHAFVNSSSIGE